MNIACFTCCSRMAFTSSCLEYEGIFWIVDVRPSYWLLPQVMWKSQKVHDHCTFFLLCFWMTFPFVRGEPEKLEQEHKEKRTLCNSSCSQGCYDSSGKHLQCFFSFFLFVLCVCWKNVSDHKEMETTDEAGTLRCRWVHCSCWSSTINTASPWSPGAHSDCGVLLTRPNSSQACWTSL